jgi:hypothetical protein
MSRNVTILKNYHRWLQIMATFVESTYNLKSYRSCQTISQFLATANGQIAIMSSYLGTKLSQIILTIIWLIWSPELLTNATRAQYFSCKAAGASARAE